MAHLNMLALGCDMPSDDHGRAYVLEELFAADKSQYRRAIARRYWLSLLAGPSPACLIPVTRRTHG
jgi:hypothetical protein